MNLKKLFVSSKPGFYFIIIALILIFFISQTCNNLLTPDIQMLNNSGINKLTKNLPNSEEFLAKTSLKAAADLVSSLLWLKVDTYYHFNISPDEVLPFIRIITLINSEFIDAWTLGAYIMCRSFKKSPKYIESINFLTEAIEKNKNNVRLHELYFEKGWNEFFYGKDFKRAINSFKKALIHFNDKNSSSICTMTNYLKLFIYSCLLTGDHRCAYKTIELLKTAYSDSINLDKSILSKLYSNYDKSIQKFNLSKIKFKSFLKEHIKNMLPPNNTDENNNFILNFNKNIFILKDIHKKIFSTHLYLKKIEGSIFKGSNNTGLNNLFSWNNIYSHAKGNYLINNEKQHEKTHLHEKIHEKKHIVQEHLHQHSHQEHSHHHHHHHHHKPILPNPLNILIESGIILFVFFIFMGVSYKKIF